MRFIDPLASSASRASLTISPANEGIDHINLREDSRSPLGRFFAPRYRQSFTLKSAGFFNCIESFILVLLARSAGLNDPVTETRLDMLRSQQSKITTADTNALPRELMRLYNNPQTMPEEMHSMIVRYVADAHMAQLRSAAHHEKIGMLVSSIVQQFMANDLPFKGYYLSPTNQRINVPQRLTIVAAMADLRERLEGVERKVAAKKKARSFDPAAIDVERITAKFGVVAEDMSPERQRDVQKAVVDIIRDKATQLYASAGHKRLDLVDGLTTAGTAVELNDVVIPLGTSIQDTPCSKGDVEAFQDAAENQVIVESAQILDGVDKDFNISYLPICNVDPSQVITSQLVDTSDDHR